MNNKMKKMAWLAIAGMMCGCMPPHVTQTLNEGGSRLAASNQYFDVSIVPMKPCRDYNYFGMFAMSVKNKTDKAIMIDWDGTKFVTGGVFKHNMAFGNKHFPDCAHSVPPEMVAANSTLTKSIYPCTNADLASSSCWIDALKDGDGIYLVTIVNGKEIVERLSVSIETR